MRVSLAALIAGACLIAASASADVYTITDLGTLGGANSSALDVNNDRQATGNSSLPSLEPGATGSTLRGFVWSEGTGMANLGSLPGATTNRFARGYSINDAGVIVGEFNNDSSRAFVYDPATGAMEGLTRLAGDTDNGVAHGINNAGVIVGISSNGTTSRATKWTKSGGVYVAADLGSADGLSTSPARAWAVNEAGDAAGVSRNALGVSQATLWTGGSAVNLTSLGGGLYSQAFGLNDSSVVVGASVVGKVSPGISTDLYRAFQWDGVNGIVELPTLATQPTWIHSEAKDVNNSGVVVGNVAQLYGSPSFGGAAVAWIDGAIINLNSLLPEGSGWNLLSAEGINDAGDIVGYGTIGGQSHAFLLTAAVPEPTAMTLLALAASFGFAARRVRHRTS